MYENDGNGMNHGSYPYAYEPVQQKSVVAPTEASVKRERRKARIGKLFFSMLLGLLFGLFAGAGFYGISLASEMVSGNIATQEAVVLDDAEDVNVSEQTEASTQTAEYSGESVTNTTADLLNVTSSTGSGTITEMVDAVMPSIVSVNNYYTAYSSYFGYTEESSEATSVGSGIIVAESEEELLLVTNYHVIEGYEELSVVFVDGVEADAYVKGTASSMDLAIIAVEISDLSEETLSAIAIATLGDSEVLQLGEEVVAIGNALGYGQSVTNGIVSALDRELAVEDVTGTFIQTNAAINPGNSGGALLNLNGEVIGITSSKIGGSAIEGMGYAIPISDAIPIIEELMGYEPKSYIGITGITVNAEVAAAYDFPVEQGVCVVEVMNGTAAAQAGLVSGDIITEFAGVEIANMDELLAELANYSGGDTVQMKYLHIRRSGTYEEISVTLALGYNYDMN